MKTKIFLTLICHYLLHEPYDLKHVPRVQKLETYAIKGQMIKKVPLNLDANAQRFKFIIFNQELLNCFLVVLALIYNLNFPLTL